MFQALADEDKEKRAARRRPSHDSRNLVQFTIPNDEWAPPKRQNSSDKPRASSRTPDPSAKRIRKSNSAASVEPVNDTMSLRWRHLAYLFDNLNRAVDELYSTCEIEENIVECEAVIRHLTMCTDDFRHLIERIEKQRDYQEARPTSIAWEVRKVTPPVEARERKRNWGDRGQAIPLGSVETDASSPRSQTGGHWSDRLSPLPLDIDVEPDAEGGASSEKAPSSSQPFKWGDMALGSPPRAATPGIILHKKLSSPERTRSNSNVNYKQRLEDRMQRAQVNRETIEKGKVDKLRQASHRHTKVNQRRTEKTQKRMLFYDEKLERADMKREAHLQERVSKMADQERKVEEVGFINRMNKADKEAAFLQRKERERAAQLQAEKEAKQAQTEKREEARRKNEEARRKRESAENESQWLCRVCNVELLNDQYRERHLAGKKHRAALERVQGRDPDVADNCIVHLAVGVMSPRIAVTAEEKQARKNKLKANKKKLKKLRERMLKAAANYAPNSEEEEEEEKESESTMATRARAKRLLVATQACIGKADWVKLARVLREIAKFLGPPGDEHAEADSLREEGVLGVLADLCAAPTRPPASVMLVLLDILVVACDLSRNADDLLHTASILSVLQLLNNKVDMEVAIQEYAMLSALFNLLDDIIRQKAAAKEDDAMCSDFIGIVMYCGVIDRIFQRLMYIVAATSKEKDDTASEVGGPADSVSDCASTSTGGMSEITSAFVLRALSFVDAVLRYASRSACRRPVYEGPPSDSIQTVGAPLLSCVLTLFGSIVLHGQGSRRQRKAPAHISQALVDTATVAFRCLTGLAVMDLAHFQSSLAAVEHRVELYHIVMFLLDGCQSDPLSPGRFPLVTEIIMLLGYLTLRNEPAQGLLSMGQAPTILQRLCRLPFQYFSNCMLKEVLFPCLIAGVHASPRNLMILEQDLHPSFLIDYLLQCKTMPKEARVFNRFPIDDVDSAIAFLRGDEEGKECAENNVDPH